MKYGFYISGKSGRLCGFLERAQKNVLRKFAVVISDYPVDEAMLQKLKTCGLNLEVIDYKRLKGCSNKEKNRALSDKMLAILERYEIDYCFSFGSHILAGELLERYKNRIINFHPAILPMFPGRKAVDQAVEAGNVFLAGNTAHFVDEGVDTGLVIMQSVIPLQSFLDGDGNYDVILDMQIDMLFQLIEILDAGGLTVENGRVIMKGADYTKGKIFPEFISEG